MSNKSSDIRGFYKLSIEDRLRKVKEFADLNDDEISLLSKESGLSLDLANRMIENVVGTISVPFGVAVNFKINNRDYLIPMAIEEPSVVAAASNAAKLARAKGGFTTSSTEPIMIGQIQVLDVENPEYKRIEILEKKAELIKLANDQDPVLVKFGGGARDLTVTIRESICGKMMVIHLLVDTRDAMGANAVNTMCEALKTEIEEITEGRVGLRIISNLAVYRLCRAKAVFDKKELGGEEIVDRIIEAYAFADADVFRCSTHNKGIMNGITALMLATGNDTRAIEAGAHTYAAYKGSYKPLTKWERNPNGDLVGSIELPLAVGLIGGATKTHPIAKIAVKILGVKTANELGEVAAALGLAQNFAAIRALATVGIQKGHMKLHARNIAVMAGAKGKEIDLVVKELIKIGKIRVDIAEDILNKIKEN